MTQTKFTAGHNSRQSNYFEIFMHYSSYMAPLWDAQDKILDQCQYFINWGFQKAIHHSFSSSSWPRVRCTGQDFRPMLVFHYLKFSEIHRSWLDGWLKQFAWDAKGTAHCWPPHSSMRATSTSPIACMQDLQILLPAEYSIQNQICMDARPVANQCPPFQW